MQNRGKRKCDELAVSGEGRVGYQHGEEDDDVEFQEGVEASLYSSALQLQIEEVIVYSDAEYASQLQLEEALSASAFHLQQEQEDEDGKPVKRRRINEVKVQEESQDLEVTQLCTICFQPKTQAGLFHMTACASKCCSECMDMYIQSKIFDKSLPIICPGFDCSENLTPEKCEAIVSKETFEKWSLALAEHSISDAQKFYCPYKDCSALLQNDTVPEVGTSKAAESQVITQAECPNCRRLFCARCKTPWHTGLQCSELSVFSTERHNDLEFLKLVNEKKWQRCAECQRTVEKISGCSHVTCRCVYYQRVGISFVTLVGRHGKITVSLASALHGRKIDGKRRIA